jgi:hypothetical protein
MRHWPAVTWSSRACLSTWIEIGLVIFRQGGVMKTFSPRTRRALFAAGTAVTAAAMIVAGVTSAAAAHTGGPWGHRHHHHHGPGYPAPGGIYAPFTNCPLLNPLMQESLGGNATGCIAGVSDSGSIKIGNITTPVTHPVIAQFGVWDPPPPNMPNQFTGGILPPLNGLSAQLVSAPELVPGGLLKALGCPSTNATVEKLCQEAQHLPKRFLNVYAEAKSAGPITNFQLTTWTQPLKFKLINPLLGRYCYIGSDDNPVVVNPMLTGKLVEEVDPNPKAHPDTAVLEIKDASATDDTFTAPGVTGCGPGGSANIAVDLAIDTTVGLPSASGTSSLTLNGTFYFAACYAPENMANILLAAFKASVGTPPASAVSKAAQPFSAATIRGRDGIR